MEAATDMRFSLQPVSVCLTLILGAVLLHPAVAMAQAEQGSPTDVTQSQPTITTQPTVSQPSLTASELQLQLKQVQDATDLTEDVKSRAIGLYTQAIQQLEIAEQWAVKAAEYDAERQRAPDRIRAFKEELATPPDEPVPDVPAGATRADLEQRLRQVQSDLEAERKTLADWERERDRRRARRRELPELVTAARTRLQTLGERLTAPEAGLAGVARRAQKALDDGTRLAVEREIDAYNNELLSYDARRDLLQAHLDRSARHIGHLEELLTAWHRVIQDRGRQESAAALREANEQLKRAHPTILPLVEERKQLVIFAKELQSESKQVDARLADTDALLAQVNQDFDKIVRRVNAAGLTNAISQLLRKHRSNLPNLRPFNYSLRKRKDRISSAQLEMTELEDRRRELTSIDEVVAGITESIGADVSDHQRTMIREAATEAIVSLRTDMDNLIRDYDLLFEKMVDVDSRERELVEVIERFDEYVDEKILWIKSGTWPNVQDLQDGQEAFRWLVTGSNWKEVGSSIAGTFRARAGLTTSYLIAVVALWLASPRLVRVVRQVGEKAPKAAQDTMGRTIAALAATVGLAARWPATLWFLAWALAIPTDQSEFAKAVAGGLSVTATIVLTLQALRQLARRNGLAEAHFRWNAHSLALLERHTAWLTLLLVPSFLVFGTLDAQAMEAAKESLGRFAFVIAFTAIALFVHRVLRPTGPILGPVLRRQQESWYYRLRHFWYPVALALPLGLVIAAIVGYYYTSLYLGSRIIQTVWLLLALRVFHALIERWLLLQIRRRAIAEARERAALLRQQQDAEMATPAEHEAVAVPEDTLDGAAINKQTLQLVRVVLFVVVAVALWGIWAETLPALGVFRDVTLWAITETASETVHTADGGTQVNEYTKTIPITLANTGLAALIALLTIVAVKNIPGLLEITILQRLPIDAGGRFAATAITRYAITVVGVIVAFAQIGVGWSKVQWLVAAMTVGLAFGLQEIFANFVSGLIILFERPVRIGDIATVGNVTGQITRIHIRATTITDWDNRELIVPNKEFVTAQITNWTLTSPVTRVVIPVGIAYGSDTSLAREVLLKVARDCEYVMDDPGPSAIFRSFGASSLDFDLRVYIPKRGLWPQMIDDMHARIDEAFRQAKIVIAFPQRDVHVRSIHETPFSAGASTRSDEGGNE